MQKTKTTTQLNHRDFSKIESNGNPQFNQNDQYFALARPMSVTQQNARKYSPMTQYKKSLWQNRIMEFRKR